MSKQKLRNNNTMTESQFWSMIRSALRELTYRWRPRSEIFKKYRRKYTGENKRRKYEYLCANCKLYFLREEVEADHIFECGSLRSALDLQHFVESLFVEIDGWQVLCKDCHKCRTKQQRIKNVRN